MKPLLASPIKNFEKLQFPLFASPKLDGWRILCTPDGPVSRNLKPVRNRHAYQILKEAGLEYYDGEIIVGDPTEPGVFGRTTSGISSFEGEPDFTYYVFDHFENPEDPYRNRLEKLRQKYSFVKIVDQVLINDLDNLLEYEHHVHEEGFEGVMVRSLDGRYKFGRSTEREGILLKMKRFEHEEGKIVGYKERMHNANEASRNALGYLERSSSKKNLIGRSDLGAFILENKKYKKNFDVGSGLTDEQRSYFWENREKYMGAYVRYKFDPYFVKDKPRFGIFAGIRHPDDL